MMIEKENPCVTEESLSTKEKKKKTVESTFRNQYEFPSVAIIFREGSSE